MSGLPVFDPADRRLNVEVALASKATPRAAVPLSEPEPLRVSAPIADLRAAPALERSLDTQLLYGDGVRLFAHYEDWGLVQAEFDGYVGWTKLAGLGPSRDPTHVVTAQRTFCYPGPDLKLPAGRTLSMASRLAIVAETQTRATSYLQTADGDWVVAGHLAPAALVSADYVEVASRFCGTPYLWGGVSGFGIDCSGLVQLAMRMCGRRVLRDSDMQAATIGGAVEPGRDHGALQRGDLIFWSGHVAIVAGDGNLLHANGASMDVLAEPLAGALDRIRRKFSEPTGYRRPAQ